MTPDYVYLLIEAVSYYLYALKWVTLVLASLMLVLGLDDLFIDLVYWGRTTWRNLGLFRRVERADESLLYSVPEKPLAIMVPAWREVGVVGAMAHLAASTLDYENYQIFVGTYPQRSRNPGRCGCGVHALPQRAQGCLRPTWPHQ